MTGDSDSSTLDNIKDKIQSILDRTFKERYRRKIDVYNDRLSFCCPICGDSMTDIRKKRGNLYLDSMRYHCYNCGENMGINAFLKIFGESLDLDDKLRVREIQQSSKKFERKVTSGSSMTFNILSRLGIPKSILFKTHSLISPYKNEFVSEYLKSRKIDIKNWKYFAFKKDSKELYILNITPDDKVIGYQIRQLDANSKKARYLSRTLSKIYMETFGRDMSQIAERLILTEPNGEKYINEEDGIENITESLDRLSGIFNVMNIDISRTLTVVEGPIDSLAIDNCVALQGASKTYDFFDNVSDVRYLFDNDRTGKEMSIKKLRNRKSVFLWDMYIKSVSPGLKVKDINDLQKKGLLDICRLNECFSDDELDIVMI